MTTDTPPGIFTTMIRRFRLVVDDVVVEELAATADEGVQFGLERSHHYRAFRVEIKDGERWVPFYTHCQVPK